MHIQMQRLGSNDQPVDPGLLGCFPKRRVNQRVIRRLTMPTELNPPANPGMQGEQHMRRVVVQ